jgi:hypothetical protein
VERQVDEVGIEVGMDQVEQIVEAGTYLVQVGTMKGRKVTAYQHRSKGKRKHGPFLQAACSVYLGDLYLYEADNLLVYHHPSFDQSLVDHQPFSNLDHPPDAEEDQAIDEQEDQVVSYPGQSPSKAKVLFAFLHPLSFSPLLVA